MRDISSIKGRYWLGVSGDTEYERLAGLTFTGIYTSMACRYMHDYGMQHCHLSMVAVKNHRHGALNDKAQFQREISLEQAEGGRTVAYPLNIWDCCGTTDGAAAVLLCRADMTKNYTDRPVYIAGAGSGSDYLAVHERESMTSLKAVVEAAKTAYKEAGVGPKDIDFAEVHDCFTIAEVMADCDLGFCEPGEALKWLEEGVTTKEGKLPVNVSGGLKSKGHPLGATGVGQACEIFAQMRGEAQRQERQLENTCLALSHNVGGSGGSAVVIIYEKGE